MSSARTYLDFERPIAALDSKIADLLARPEGAEESEINVLREKSAKDLKALYKSIGPWQKTQVARHAQRPHFLDYINGLVSNYTALAGDRKFGDDDALLGGLGKIRGRSVMVMGHEKGTDTQTRLKHNFGMAQPEGYRKAVRLMQMAERFDIPVVSFVDTAGAFPGRGAEERGQAEAIARNLFEMAQLRVPIVCAVIGEGASGGAIGIGLGDHVMMLENTWYSVISPESCSSILWRSWDYKEQAADALKLTAEDMLGFGIIDEIIKEPQGGAHSGPEEMAKSLKRQLKKAIVMLQAKEIDEVIEERINKYSEIGRVESAG